MARGQVLGGAIPTAMNFLKNGPIPPCPTLLRPAVRDFEGLGGQGVSHPGGEERKARGQV